MNELLQYEQWNRCFCVVDFDEDGEEDDSENEEGFVEVKSELIENHKEL